MEKTETLENLHFGKHKNDDKTKKSFKQMEGD
jgi:hypothetical protein